MNNDKGMTEKYIGQKGFLKSKIFKVKKIMKYPSI
jgi:hypothetical protein